MNQTEQVHTDSRNHEPTEAEKTLGSMPEYSEYQKERASNPPSQKKEKLSFEEREKKWIKELSDINLLEAEEETRHSIKEILNETMFGLMDRWNLPMYIDRRDLIEKEKKRRGEDRPEFIEAKEIMRDTSEVRSALANSQAYLSEYFENTCKQRLADGTGSVYDNIEEVDDMEEALYAAHWKKAEHPDVIPGCQAYKTKDIKGGHLGLLKIAELPDDATITASDPKGTGKVSMTVTGEKGSEVEETWLIVGDEDGHDVVYTFHPGEPVRPSIVEVKDCPDGTKLTKEQAIELGFDLAKIV